MLLALLPKNGLRGVAACCRDVYAEDDAEADFNVPFPLTFIMGGGEGDIGRERNGGDDRFLSLFVVDEERK